MDELKKVWSEKTISNWLDIRNIIDERNNKDWIFRGQASHKWNLTSSFYRMMHDISGVKENTPELEKKCINIEKQILNLFRAQKHMFYSEIPQNKLNDIEELSVLQHYGAPTRLLDWSYSPYIALFFAVENAIEDCALFSLNINQIKDINEEMINKINVQYKDSVSFSKNKIDFSKSESIIKFGEFLTNNKLRGEGVQDEVILDLYEPLIKNERLVRQQGLFLVPSKISINLDDILHQSYNITNGKNHNNIIAEKIIIPKSLKKEILHNLMTYNITNELLFPGIDGFCQSLKTKVLLSSN